MGLLIAKWNFHFAVWAIIIGGLVFLISIDSSQVGITREFPRPPYAVALITVFEFVLWFIFYRHGEGQAAASIIGVYLVVPVFSELLGSQVVPNDISVPAIGIFGYLSASHFIYAFAGWRLREFNASDL